MSIISNNFVKVAFNCTQFHPDKMARNASEDLQVSKQAEKGVAKVMVDLFGKSRELKDINNKARACRNYLSRIALPFGTERGSYVIHVADLPKLGQLQDLIDEFYALVKDFIMHYDALKKQGLAKLGNTLTAGDAASLYPKADDIAGRFTASYRLYPLPEGVPVGIPSDFVQQVADSMEAQHAEAQRTAQEAVIGEIKTLVASIQNHATKVLEGKRTKLDEALVEGPELMQQRYALLDKLGADTADGLKDALANLAGLDLRAVKTSSSKATEALELTNEILQNMGIGTMPAPEPVVVEPEPEPEPVVVEAVAEPEPVVVEPVVEAVAEPVVETKPEPDKFDKSNEKLKNIADLFSDFDF